MGIPKKVKTNYASILNLMLYSFHCLRARPGRILPLFLTLQFFCKRHPKLTFTRSTRHCWPPGQELLQTPGFTETLQVKPITEFQDRKESCPRSARKISWDLLCGKRERSIPTFIRVLCAKKFVITAWPFIFWALQSTKFFMAFGI